MSAAAPTEGPPADIPAESPPAGPARADRPRRDRRVRPVTRPRFPKFPPATPAAWTAGALRGWLTPRVPTLAGPLADRAAGFGVLMYHRFADPVPGLPAPTWNVPPAKLRRQLRGLLRAGFTPVPLADAVAARAAGDPVDPRAFVVTIDDGYRNNLTAGLPVFEELGVPVTLFVATGYLDSDEPYPFDDWPAKGDARAPRDAWVPMTTAECRRFAASPVASLGAHTHTHQDFRGRPREFAADVRECCRVLRDRFGVERPAFAFPYGTPERGFSRGVLAEALKTTPVRAALTTADERVRPDADPLDWGRFTATEFDTAATLAAKLDGRFEAVKRLTGRLHAAPAPPAPAPPARGGGADCGGGTGAARDADRAAVPAGAPE